MASNQTSELYLKVLKLEQETELLRNINRALREENIFLKESLEKIGSGQQGDRLLQLWLLSSSPKLQHLRCVFGLYKTWPLLLGCWGGTQGLMYDRQVLYH